MTDDFFPAPTAAPLRGGPTLRVGVIGTGEIAGDFVDALHRHTDQRVTAVASRSQDRAERFSREHDAGTPFDSIERLAASPEVDVVYVATPHPLHREGALAAIAAGKHALIEKPVTMSAAEAEEIRDAASAAGVLAMEAMWTRYLPHSTVVAQLLERGDLGRIRLATVEVGWRADLDSLTRLTDPALGGGAILDMGVYAFWFLRLAGGPAVDVRAVGSLADSGIDIQSVTALRTERGVDAAATVTMAVGASGIAAIHGEEGVLRFTDSFVFPAGFTVETAGGRHDWTDTSGVTGRDGLAYQVAAMARFVDEGLTDSPIHSWDDAVGTMRVLDAAREQIGAR